MSLFLLRKGDHTTLMLAIALDSEMFEQHFSSYSDILLLTFT